MSAQKKNQETEKQVMTQQPDYHAYLLRLWREGAQKPWRAELVSPHTGDRRHFADQGQLIEFLMGLTTET